MIILAVKDKVYRAAVACHRHTQNYNIKQSYEDFQNSHNFSTLPARRIVTNNLPFIRGPFLPVASPVVLRGEHEEVGGGRTHGQRGNPL